MSTTPTIDLAHERLERQDRLLSDADGDLARAEAALAAVDAADQEALEAALAERDAAMARRNELRERAAFARRGVEAERKREAGFALRSWRGYVGDAPYLCTAATYRRPYMSPKSERFELRIDEEQLARIHAWAEEQEPRPTGAEAVRRLIDLGLAAGSPRSVHFSDGEKMLILMLADLYKHLRIKDADCDAEFLAEVIYGGHYWAPRWKLTGVFHDHVDDPGELDHVVDVLDMWEWLELSHERLSAAERKRVASEAVPFGEDVHFYGFDGNEESSQLGIARFLIEKLERFTRFKKRDLNAHHETHTGYRRMLKVFLPMRETLAGRRGLTVEQVIAVLNAGAARG